MWSPSKILRVALSIAATVALSPVVGEFFVELAKERGLYDQPSVRVGAVMTWLSTLTEPLWFRISLAFLLGLALGAWLDAILSRRETAPLRARATKDFKDLAERAKNLAASINRLVSETQTRPPTHPKYGLSTERWQVDNHERRESAMRSYLTQYGADVSAVLDSAFRWGLVNNSEVWRVSHLTGDDLLGLAQLLSAVSSRAAEVEITEDESSPLRLP